MVGLRIVRHVDGEVPFRITYPTIVAPAIRQELCEIVFADHLIAIAVVDWSVAMKAYGFWTCTVQTVTPVGIVFRAVLAAWHDVRFGLTAILHHRGFLSVLQPGVVQSHTCRWKKQV